MKGHTTASQSSFLEDLDICISVDVETSGPIPSLYSLLSIGACTLLPPRQSFYVELKPDHTGIDPHAQKIHRLDYQKLALEGTSPEKALLHFEQWIEQLIPAGKSPLFVAFNAPFDWMFINDYFHRYLGHNPFGHKALDIKAYYLGASKFNWADTSGSVLHALYLEGHGLTHNALHDAIDQADIFIKILAEYAGLKIPETKNTAQ